MPGREALPKVSNWGRWGKDDEKGTANFITPEVIVVSPATIMSMVDLPQPECPITVTNSPLRNLKSRSLTMTASPFGEG